MKFYAHFAGANPKFIWIGHDNQFWKVPRIKDGWAHREHHECLSECMEQIPNPLTITEIREMGLPHIYRDLGTFTGLVGLISYLVLCQ